MSTEVVVVKRKEPVSEENNHVSDTKREGQTEPFLIIFSKVFDLNEPDLSEQKVRKEVFLKAVETVFGTVVVNLLKVFV